MATAAQQHAITEALRELRDGVSGAMHRLVPLVYADLARMAHRQLALEAGGHTLSTTALVHEAYLRLVDQTRAQWNDRAQFFARGRARDATRAGGSRPAARRRAARRRAAPAVSLEALEAADVGSLAAEQRSDILLALDEALDRLATLDPRRRAWSSAVSSGA
jgi:hypothetical protein